MKKAYPYIRWSSKKQEEGDSENRQRKLIEESKEWLKGLGYELDESMNLIDRGESAFTGTPPSLARFLKAVKNGDVERGSMLIAESFDRLNRSNPEDAMWQFLDLKRDGISIGILGNRKVYEPGQDWTELILPLVESGRANSESEWKRKRLKAVWAEKRRKAVDEGIRSKHKCPYWLRWDEQSKVYVPVEDAVKAVLHVYELKLKGWGAIRISKEMNQLKMWMPPISKGNEKGLWDTSYVNRCLRSETPIGTYAPHLRIKEKQPDGTVKIHRPPACDPILNYYPSIFQKEEEHKFYEVQRKMDLVGSLPGKGGGGGRNDKESNIFKGIVRCGVCGGNMYYVDKSGKKSKSPKDFLYCAKAKVNHECTARPVNYSRFVKLFFDHVKELTVQDILPNPQEQQDEIEQLQKEFHEGDKYLKTLATKAEAIVQAVAESRDARNRAMYDKRLTEVNNEIERVTKKVERADKDLQNARHDAEKLSVLLRTSNELYQKLCDMPEGPDKVELRKRIRDEIRELIDHIVIYPIPKSHEFPGEINLEKPKGASLVKIMTKDELAREIEELESEGDYEVLESGLVETMTKQVRIVYRVGRQTTISKTLFMRSVWEIA